METTTCGEAIFNVVKDYFGIHSIPLQNILSCACDGAPSMAGKHRGFLARLKAEVPSLITIHCIIHRHHLVAKNLSEPLNETLELVIKAINFIKGNSLRDRIFHKLCEEGDEVHKRLLMHTEVRWLSKGKCLARFVELYDLIVESVSLQLKEFLIQSSVRRKISYMADIFNRMNENNLQLQGKNVTLIDSKRVISTLIQKLALYKRNLARRSYEQFPMLAEIICVSGGQPNDEELMIFTDHLEKLIADMKIRFADLCNLVIPPWVISINSIDPTDFHEDIQEELIEAQNDNELQISMGIAYAPAWMHARHRYPKLFEISQPLLLTFPTSYMVEAAFSHVAALLSKQRNRLDIVKRGDIRLKLTNITPRVQQLAKNIVGQGSH